MIDFVDQRKVIHLSFAIILTILAFIAPAAILYPLKPGFITREAIGVGTSGWSLITGGIGFLTFAILFFTSATVERKRIKALVFSFCIVIGCVGILLSVRDYYYATPRAFIYNAPFSFASTVYEWTDFERVEEKLSTMNGVKQVEHVSFQMTDGRILTYDSGEMMRMYTYISNKVTDAGGTVERIESP